MGLSFKIDYPLLPRVRVECDLVTDHLENDTASLYRHVFLAEGCGHEEYSAEVKFTNSGGVFSSPVVSVAGLLLPVLRGLLSRGVGEATCS